MKTLLKILAGIVLFLHTYLSISVWLRIAPPANVIFAIPKIIVPNIINKMLLFDAAILIVLVVIALIRKWKISAFGYVSMGFFLLYCISAVVYMQIINQVTLGLDAVTYDIHKVNTDVMYTRVDLIKEGQAIDTRINEISLYLPEENLKHTCFIYLPYGNYRIHDDMAMHERLRTTMLDEGYSVAFISGVTRLNGDITDIVKNLKVGVGVLKEYAAQYGITEFVISGGSAGGHLAQLVAFTDQVPLYTHDDLQLDTTIDGVVSFYGTSDLSYDLAYFAQPEHMGLFDYLGDWMYSMSATEGEKTLAEANEIMTYGVLNGPPSDENILYEMSNTRNLVSADSPKTLLIHGTHDSMTPVEADYLLYAKMQDVGSDVTFMALPFVDHAFDSMMNEGSVVVDKAFEEVMHWMLVNFE